MEYLKVLIWATSIRKSLLMHGVLKYVPGTLKSINSEANFTGIGHEERRMYVLALVLYFFITTLCLLPISCVA